MKIADLRSAAEVFRLHIHQHPPAPTIKSRIPQKNPTMNREKREELQNLDVPPKTFPHCFELDTAGLTRPISIMTAV